MTPNLFSQVASDLHPPRWASSSCCRPADRATVVRSAASCVGGRAPRANRCACQCSNHLPFALDACRVSRCPHPSPFVCTQPRAVRCLCWAYCREAVCRRLLAACDDGASVGASSAVPPAAGACVCRCGWRTRGPSSEQPARGSLSAPVDTISHSAESRIYCKRLTGMR